jgi:hypothetical protein
VSKLVGTDPPVDDVAVLVLRRASSAAFIR